MKALLRFDLSDPEERIKHMQCIKAQNMVDVLLDLTTTSRKRFETIIEQYEARGGKLSAEDMLDHFYDHLVALLEENSVNLDDVYLP